MKFNLDPPGGENSVDVEVNYYEPADNNEPVEIGYTVYEEGTEKIIDDENFINEIHHQIIVEYESQMKE